MASFVRMECTPQTSARRRADSAFLAWVAAERSLDWSPGGESFAAAREARHLLASVRTVGSRPPPLALTPGQSAGIPSCRNVTATEFELAAIVGGALAH